MNLRTDPKCILFTNFFLLKVIGSTKSKSDIQLAETNYQKLKRKGIILKRVQDIRMFSCCGYEPKGEETVCLINHHDVFKKRRKSLKVATTRKDS